MKTNIGMLENEEDCKRPKIGIVLLNYCNHTDTIRCLKSLLTLQYHNYVIYIIDNNSPNNSIRELQKYEGSNVQVFESGYNGGFAFGNNVGIRIAIQQECKYVLLLNNDTTVEPNILDELLRSASQFGNVGIATGRIMYGNEKSKIWYAGGDIDWHNLRANHRGINSNYVSNKSNEQTSFVEFASGCCMFISADIIREVGYLPEEYFMYYEDLDYCVKMQNAKKVIVYNPNAIVYHYVSSSSGGEDSPFCVEWQSRARRKFLDKYSTFKFSTVEKLLVYLKCELRTIIKILLSKNAILKFKAYAKSFKDQGAL